MYFYLHLSNHYSERILHGHSKIMDILKIFQEITFMIIILPESLAQKE